MMAFTEPGRQGLAATKWEQTGGFQVNRGLHSGSQL
jgi:hypothetical protein